MKHSFFVFSIVMLSMQLASVAALADPDCDAIRAPFQQQFHRDWLDASTGLYYQRSELETNLADFSARYRQMHPGSATSGGETRRDQLNNIRRLLEQNRLIFGADEQDESGRQTCTFEENGSTAFLSECKTDQWHDNPSLQIMSADRDGKRVVEVCSTRVTQTSVQFENVVISQCLKSDDFPLQPMRLSSSDSYLAMTGNKSAKLHGIEQDEVVSYYIQHGVPQRCLVCPVNGEDRNSAGNARNDLNHRGGDEHVGGVLGVSGPPSGSANH